MGKNAKIIFTHYFRTLAKYAGMNWDCDNDAEIEAAIDSIINEIKEDLKGVSKTE